MRGSKAKELRKAMGIIDPVRSQDKGFMRKIKRGYARGSRAK